MINAPHWETKCLVLLPGTKGLLIPVEGHLLAEELPLASRGSDFFVVRQIYERTRGGTWRLHYPSHMGPWPVSFGQPNHRERLRYPQSEGSPSLELMGVASRVLLGTPKNRAVVLLAS